MNGHGPARERPRSGYAQQPTIPVPVADDQSLDLVAIFAPPPS